ncbi:ferritin-like domain-containing protein [Croceicoccus sp. F390]|uniref:Ferritin-like domain-containing protein n=1 Tax=Croceicoccus esteveae TaxID=3075597 RepID=A0ABU2ZH43_9SPHN|nr:ferritin-like domain-containing protein [Croceicoccus sp. F390]MDT0575920.1 ferritin-like domain-containing protein [Croceicoccus sp. F390]
MAAPENLMDCYTEELADNWSANDQMEKMVRKLAAAAGDAKLKQRLEKSAEGIARHTEVIKELLDDCGKSSKEHCKGMEGLVKEAQKHVLDAGIKDDDVRDVIMIAQYQRMCHYGICGFGTAKAFAEALGKDDHVKKLDKITSSIYDADENMTDLAERSANLHAKNAG